MAYKEKIAVMLDELYPEYEFSAERIYRDYTSNHKNGGLCYWWAEGRKYKSFLRYDFIHVYGHSTMKDSVKHGLQIIEYEKPLEVVFAKH